MMYISVLSFKFGGFESRKVDVSPDRTSSASGPQRCWTKSAWAEDCNGSSWRLRLSHLPDRDIDEEAMVSFVVDKEELEDGSPGAKTKFSIILRDADGSAAIERAVESSHISFDCKNFIERHWVLDRRNNILIGGALYVDLVVQPELKVGFARLSSQNTFVTNMLRLLESGEMTDLFFEFPREDHRSFSAHRLVLSANAPEMMQLFEDADSIPVECTTPKIFRRVLHYVYGGGPPEEDFMLEHATDLIRAANYFGVEGLKLEAEAALVASRDVTVVNVVNRILFADANECALLKEYAASVFAARFGDVMNTDSFSELSRSQVLMRELMMSIVDYGRLPQIEGLRTMSVITLRKMLEEKGLDIDGSKEMLISRLQSSG